jgi:hypothetical protein
MEMNEMNEKEIEKLDFGLILGITVAIVIWFFLIIPFGICFAIYYIGKILTQVLLFSVLGDE